MCSAQQDKINGTFTKAYIIKKAPTNIPNKRVRNLSEHGRDETQV